MVKGQAVYYPSYNKQARINLISATRNLFYLLFGRIPDKFLGFLILSVFLITLGLYGIQTSGFSTSFSRLEISTLPTFVQTIYSPGSKKLRAEESVKQINITTPIQASVQTPLQTLDYSRRVKMFATSYDKNCPGCSGTTATGLSTGYGVVAVDPNVIPLGSKLYIPGYGVAVAGDTGGAIKGNKIDLGFNDIKSGWWSARVVDVYVLR